MIFEGFCHYRMRDWVVYLGYSQVEAICIFVMMVFTIFDVGDTIP